MKPTVIAGGKKPVEPTSIGSKPTVIQSSSAAKPAPVMAEKKMKPTTWVPVQAPPPAPVPSQPHPRPSKLQGTERHSLAVSKDQLSKQFIAYDDGVLEETQRLLGEITLEIFDTQACLMYGISIQEKYGQSVDKWLKVLEGDHVRTTGRHVQRLKEVLQSIATSLQAGQTWFKRESIQSKFGKIKPEIDQLRQLLRTGEQQLSLANRELVELKSQTLRLIREATGYMLSCEYLSSLVSDEKARLLTDRGMALSKTIGLLQQQQLKLEQDEQNITALLTSIQDGVLIALPALLSTVATAVQDEKNDTQRFVIRDQLMDVIRKLT